MKRIKEHYEIAKKSHRVLGVFLQGSQNYNLDYADSDVDSKAILMPSFEDICLNKQPVSTTMILDNDEHIDLKDIRLMFQNFKKQNINFVEILFTKFFVINPMYQKLWDRLTDNREKIVKYDIHKSLDCICGMSMQKVKALTHPYPSLIKTIKKFGYDPKQLHHIIRLNNFIKSYLGKELYSDCLISSNREYMINVKQGKTHNLKQAKESAKRISEETYSISKEYKQTNDSKIDESVEILLNDILIEAMKINLKDCL